MIDQDVSPASDLAETEADAVPNRAEWAEAMEKATEDSGYFHNLGDKHWALFTDEGTTLLVSFETLGSILARPGQMPLGHAVAMSRGWSHLCLIADGATWFRDPAIYSYFDRQVDDAFFEDFDQVLFYGAGMGAYAACAYAVTAPGAQVLALNPRATMDPDQTRWENRDRPARRLDFTSRYGYAPEMLEGAGQAFVIHDPTLPPEAMHAALFRAPYITRLSARHFGDALEGSVMQMGLLQPLIDLAMAGTLNQASFAKLWRARRSYAPYLKTLLARAEANGRRQQEIMICRSVTNRLRAPRFAKRLARLTQQTEDVSALAQD